MRWEQVDQQLFSLGSIATFVIPSILICLESILDSLLQTLQVPFQKFPLCYK